MAAGGAKDAQELDRESERYREAATVALEQLQWVINYLRGINKNKLAQGLDATGPTSSNRPDSIVKPLPPRPAESEGPR